MYSMKVLKVSYYMVSFLMIMMILWFTMSFVDVVIHNLNPAPVYQSWNLFTLLTGVMG
jgi:hypothetical protein